MTIPKAIEILDLNIRQRSPSMPPDVLEALKLGREALQRLGKARETRLFASLSLLPGETEE